MTDSDHSQPQKSNLALFLAKRRTELGINQIELAQRSGLSSGTIASIESGHSQMPKADTLSKLAKGLKVTYQELDCIVRDIPYQASVSGGITDPFRNFEHYLLNHPKMPREVAETIVDMIRVVVQKYE